MFSRRISMYSSGMFLLGFLLLCSVRVGLAQQQDATASTGEPVAAVALTTATYANGVKTRIRGTIITVSDCQLTMRDECGAESVVLLNQRANGKLTEIKLQGHRRRFGVGNLCPGACIRVEGRGNCEGQLVAEEIHSRGCPCEPVCAPACPPPCPPPCPTACAPPCPPPNPCVSCH